jgi:kinesin family protein 1
MEAGTHTFLDPPPTENEAGAGDQKSKSKSSATDKETKSFAFDHSYWSACPKDEPGYASQQTLYEDLGVDLLNNSFEGYNSCIFACQSFSSSAPPHLDSHSSPFFPILDL